MTNNISECILGEITLTSEKSVKYTEGDRAMIECEAHVITAALLPSFSWKINGMDLEDACPERCTIKNTTTTHTVISKLEIVDITMEDRKNYTCTATNAAHPEGVSKDILLRVRGMSSCKEEKLPFKIDRNGLSKIDLRYILMNVPMIKYLYFIELKI